MLHDITLPSFGSSVGEATLLQWLVTPGTEVGAGQVIAEIETDKAIAELEAPEAGVIESIEVAEGSEGVATGTVLARLRVSGQEARATATDDPVPESAGGNPGTAAAGTPSPTRSKSPQAAQDATDRSGRIFASPFARRLAEERNVPLQDVAGSGPGGRIVSRDLDISEAAVTTGNASALDEFGHDAGSYSLAPVSRMRRAIAEGLTRSVREIPCYSLTLDVALDAALDLRADLNRALREGDAKISVNDLVIRACARALMEVPDANRSWTDRGIALHRHANIALAVALDDGLVAPVLHRAEAMTLRQIAEASTNAIRDARGKKLTRADLQGATMTVSNLGMLGIRSFTSIPSLPQACILSVGAVEPRPVVRDGELAAARLATFTLTCDHRVIDGATGARFLSSLRESLESPGSLAEIEPA